MKRHLIILMTLLSALSARAQLSSTKVYDNFVQFYAYTVKEVNLGGTFDVHVCFRQSTRTFPYNKNGDMSKQPVFPDIDGLVRMGEPKKRSSVEESKQGNKVTGKTYEDEFTYTLLADKPGTYSFKNIKITFRGTTLTADAATIVVKAAKPTLDATVPQIETEEKPNVVVYETPHVERKTAPRAFIEAIKLYADRTEVELSYTSKGENVYSSSNCYIQDALTKENVKMRFMRGDVGYDKKWFAAGTKLKYTMVFPPIKDTWRNVNIIENVSGGFCFYNVGLANKPAQGSVRKGISRIDYSQMKRVTLNNYDSDFLFTDGMLPVYNKDVGKWGFYNEQGDKAVDFLWDYDTFSYPHFGGGYCIVSKVRKVNGFYYTDYYSIDKAGKAVKLNGVDKVTPFCDGLAAVVKSGKYTYIKGNGQELSAALAQYIGSEEPKAVRPFVDGLSAYYDYNKEKYGFINAKGTIVIPARYEEVHDFSEGLAAVKLPASASNGATWGFIDTKGQMVIPANYTREPSSFSQGLAVAVKRNGDEIMINKQGQVASPEFRWLFPFFSTGYTLAQPKETQGMFVIDKSFAVVTGPVYGVEGKHRRYAEHHGAFQTPVFAPGYTNCYSYLTTGEYLFGISLKQTGVMSDNLIHMPSEDGHFFVDYNGKAVFMFVESEF